MDVLARLFIKMMANPHVIRTVSWLPKKYPKSWLWSPVRILKRRFVKTPIYFRFLSMSLRILVRHIDRPLWLHVGAPKTGTSVLQCDIFPYHPQIGYCGKWYPDIWRLCSHHTRAIEQVSFIKIWNYMALAGLNLSGLTHNSGITKPKLYLLSDEGILTNLRKHKLCQTAISGKSKVLYVIRNETSHLHSIWLEMLSQQFNQGCRTADEYARVSSADASLKFYGITQATLADGTNVYKPRSFVEETLPTMGEEIHVLPYELFVEEPKAYLNKISNLMGIDPEVTWKLYDNASGVRQSQVSKAKVDAPGKRNMAMRQRGLEFHQHFKHSWATYDADPKFFFKTAEEYAATLPTKPRRAFTDTLREIKSKPYGSSCWYIRKLIAEPRFNAWMTSGEEAKVEFSAETLARLREIRAPQNRWLAEKFNLDLKRYGYAM